MRLTQACPREDLEIVDIHTDYRHKRHLENLSLLKGEKVTCLYNRSGDVVIKVKDGRIAINWEFAKDITVEPMDEKSFVWTSKTIGFGKKKKVIEYRVPTKEAQRRFKEEDEEMRKVEKEAKMKLRAIREERKAHSKEEKHD